MREIWGQRMGRSVLPAVAGALVVVAVLIAGLLAPRTVVLTSLLITGPLLCCLTAGPRTTGIVGALAIFVALLEFTWGPAALPSSRYWVPLAVTIVGAGFAVRAAELRRRVFVDAKRMRVLADLGGTATAGKPLQRLARDITALLVPRVVDLCVIEQPEPDGKPVQLAASYGPDPGAHVSSPLDLDQLKLTSHLEIPLEARERQVGTLILGTTGNRRGLRHKDEAEYFHTLAGRIALALDNAVLSGLLSGSEREREAILANVEAGIIAQAPSGEMVYVNQSVARLLGLADARDAIGRQPAEILAPFDMLTPEGDLASIEDFPTSRLLAGEVSSESTVLRSVERATGIERWLLSRASAVTGPDGSRGLTIIVLEDITETKRNEVAQRLLASTSRHLTGIEDIEAALQAVADTAVPELTDWAGIALLEDRALRTVALAHRDPEKVRLGWRLNAEWPPDLSQDAAAGRVLRTGQGELMREIPPDLLTEAARSPEHLEVLRALGLNSSVVAPIQTAGEVLGTVSFVSSTSRRFDGRDLELAVDLGRQVGAFLASHRLHAEQAHIAQTLQASLVPEVLRDPEGWRLSSAYRAVGVANEVGGDFYDVVNYAGGWAVVIGDVVGKGALAASLTAVARHTLTAVIAATGDGAQALEVLNRRLLDRPEDTPGLTTVVVLMIADDGSVTVMSMGHPLPLLRRDGEVRSIGRTSPMLGYLQEIDVEAETVHIRPGDQIVLYTDGALDAVGPRDRFGEERLHEAVRELGGGEPGELAERLVRQIERFSGGAPGDDVAIITICRTGATLPLGAGSRAG